MLFGHHNIPFTKLNQVIFAGQNNLSLQQVDLIKSIFCHYENFASDDLFLLPNKKKILLCSIFGYEFTFTDFTGI